MESRQNEVNESRLIADNFSLLLENQHKILSHPHLKMTWSPVFYLSFAYISGGGHVPIHYLFKAWDRGEMIGHCPHCDRVRQTKSFHLFNLGGSVLSGAHRGWGVCARCLESSAFTYNEENDGLKFAQRVTDAIALKRELEIPDDFAKQWLGAEAVADVRGGMTLDGKREFIGCGDPPSDPDNNRLLVSIPPSLGKLVEILQS